MWSLWDGYILGGGRYGDRIPPGRQQLQLSRTFSGHDALLLLRRVIGAEPGFGYVVVEAAGKGKRGGGRRGFRDYLTNDGFSWRLDSQPWCHSCRGLHVEAEREGMGGWVCVGGGDMVLFGTTRVERTKWVVQTAIVSSAGG